MPPVTLSIFIGVLVKRTVLGTVSGSVTGVTAGVSGGKRMAAGAKRKVESAGGLTTDHEWHGC